MSCQVTGKDTEAVHRQVAKGSAHRDTEAGEVGHIQQEVQTQVQDSSRDTEVTGRDTEAVDGQQK